MNSGLKSHFKFLKTFCEEICFLSVFLSKVILLTYCLSFKMRYWKVCATSEKVTGAVFMGTCVQILWLTLNVRTYISAVSGQNELGKKI